MKTKIYAVIFALLLSFVAFTFYTKSVEEKEAKRDKDFKVTNFNELTRILIESKTGKTITLTAGENGWVLNNKYPVRQHLFDKLKQALTQMEPFNPVPKIATKHVINEMIENAIKVSIFKNSDKADKVIYVGGPNLTNTASNMFLEYDGVAVNKIYQVGIPGHRGYLTDRFYADETTWRSMKIFDYNTSNFKSIHIKYFNKYGKEDFTLTSENNQYSLQYKDKKYSNDQLNQKMIVNYILQLENQNTMAYVFQEPNEQIIKDSLLREKKFAEIEITDIDNNTKKMIIVDKPLSKTSNKHYDKNGDPMTYDIDYKYIIFGENKEWGIVSLDKFGKLYIDPKNFIK